MGLSRLVLVQPAQFPAEEATARAAGADDVLASAQVVDSLDAALAGCHFVLGTTARRRGIPLPELLPRDAATAIHDADARGEGTAILFGRERTGLYNEELARCHAAIHVPTVKGFQSLNLAAAVQIFGYEWRMAELAAGPHPPKSRPARDLPAADEDFEQFFAHLATTLDAIDFHKGRPPSRAMQRMRRMFLRMAPSARELGLLHGVLADTERMARLAQETEAPAENPPTDPSSANAT